MGSGAPSVNYPNVGKGKQFYSTSLPSPCGGRPSGGAREGTKLIINSSPDNIVFINNQSILTLPNISGIKKNILNKNIKNMREDLFTVLLLKLVVNLKPGIYDLKFYFYMDSSIVTYVYTFDFFF